MTAGDKVAADMRIIKFSDLKINNASLTGENVDLKLSNEPLHLELYEAKNVARSGCNFTQGIFIIKGTGTAIIFSTGDKTFFGAIAASTI